MKLIKLVSVFAGGVIFTACAGNSDIEVNPGNIYNRSEPLIEDSDFDGDCRIQVRSSEINQSGKCNIIFSDDNQFRLSILHPFGGTLLQSYMDEDIVQMMDSVNETFIQSKNKATNRKKILGGFNLTLDEIRQIFFGREDSGNDQVVFLYKKSIPYAARIRGVKITYKKWSNFHGILFPKSIIIEDLVAGNKLKVVFTNIDLPPAEGKKYRLLENYNIKF